MRRIRIWPFRSRSSAAASSASASAQAAVVVDPLAAEDEEQRYRPIEWPLLNRMILTLRPYWKGFAVGLLLAMVQLTLEMQSPRFMQWIIGYVTDFTDGRLSVTQNAAIAHVVMIVSLWAIAFAVALVLQRYTIFAMTGAGERVQFDLRRKLFEHLQRLSMSYYDRTKLGRIISRCTSDVAALREVNVWGVHIILANALMMMIAAVMLLMTSWQLFLSVAWLGVVLVVVNNVYSRTMGRVWQVAREGYTRVSTNLAENITGMRVVTAFSRQGPNLDTFNGLQRVNTNNNVHASRLNGIYQPLLQIIGYLGKIIILAFGGYLVVSGRLSRGHSLGAGVGAVVAAYLYWDWFMGPIINFGNFYNTLMMAMASAERIFSLLDMQPEVSDTPDARPLPRIVGRVRFEHVTFGYKPEKTVLHDIDFEASPGQVIALVGATGSGKSSIISLIARFYQPQQGRILVDDHDIRCITGESLHRQMGLVLQTNYLFGGTVMDNIRYVKEGATDEQVVASARAIGSYSAIMSLKDGFQTEVGERGGNLSLGQRQLVCFTRAFLADPRIFMLDEATSSVDAATELQVQHSLEKLLAGRTTFIVAHRLSTIMRADCILVIDAGRIIERGNHRQLVEADGKYAHLYRQFIEQ